MIDSIRHCLIDVDDYAVISRQNENILVMIKGYSPFGNCTLDAYYLTSNRLYHTAREIVRILQAQGNRASIRQDLSYRGLCFETGLAQYRGVNTMAISDKYGSYFCINVVCTDRALVEFGQNETRDTVDRCIGCNRCVTACRSGAIGLDGSFDASRCVRSYMEGCDIDGAMLDMIGDKFFGCDDCQRVCPHNDVVPSVAADCDILDAIQGALYDYRPFETILGGNYARAKVVYHNAIIRAGNSGSIDDIPRLEELGKQERFAHNARLAIDKINARYR